MGIGLADKMNGYEEANSSTAVDILGNTNH